MKNFSLPSRAELVRAYEQLHPSRRSIPDLKHLIIWAHWSRLDARLAEILVRYFIKKFKSLNPFILWKVNFESPQPQALFVLIEFAKILAKQECDRPTHAELKLWSEMILSRGVPAPAQMFFIEDGWPKPNRALNESANSITPYLKWGFFGSERIAAPKNDRSRNLTLLNRSQRIRILDELIGSNKNLTVDEYFRACGGRVHRRTAERDLQSDKRLLPVGSTRAMSYRVR